MDINGIDRSSSEFYLIVLLWVEILPNRGGEKMTIKFRGGLLAMLKSKLRVYADNEKIRALIQKIQDQYAKADKVLR